MPPSSELVSPEDNFRIWEFMTVSWLGPLIRVGSSRQLQDADVWQLPKEFQHERLHDRFRQLKGTVIRRLIRAHVGDIIILSLFGILELVLQYSTPVLLQLLLRSMEDSTASIKEAILYAGLALLARLIAAQLGVFSLWYGRRCYEQSRGEMITMLYEKTLDRKIGLSTDQKPIESNAADQDVDEKPKWWKRVWYQASMICSKRSKAAQVVKEPASMGKILNLMRNDVYEVAQRFWEIQGLVQKPLSVVFSVALVVRLLGWPSMLAVLALFLAQAIVAIIARIRIHFEKKRRVKTDLRLLTISQFVEAIRHLRWYGWQGAWLDKVMEARQKELNLRIITESWSVLIGFVNTLTLDLSPVIAFFAYTVIAGKPLRVDIAFPAMQLFQMMTTALRDLPDFITVLINAYVAVGRIEDYMAEPDKQEMNTEALIGDSMAIQAASFAWPETSDPVLKDISLSFPQGFTIVFGEVGSGKTALLQALLGELDILYGELVRPNEPIGYCAQTPWLQSMSIRENILFGELHSRERYYSVVQACELEKDLQAFKDGDSSLIGENGIGLSGGQRARITLARALYSKAKILLLDDPLSALDQQTAEAIVQNLSRHFTPAGLLCGRTVVVVTHRTDLVINQAVQAIQMRSGCAFVQATSETGPEGNQSSPHSPPSLGYNVKPAVQNLRAQLWNRFPTYTDDQINQLLVGVLQSHVQRTVPDTDPVPHNTNDVFHDGDEDHAQSDDAKAHEEEEQADSVEAEKFIEDEHREHGGVKPSVYWEFIKAGKLRWWLLLVLVLVVYRLSALAEAWFLKTWGEAYSQRPSSALLSPSVFAVNAKANIPFLDHLPPPAVNIRPWLLGFFALALYQSISFIFFRVVMVIIVYTSGKSMFAAIMQRVAGANFRFYDVTPVGRLMNRMTSDIGVVDGNISMQLQSVAWLSISWISAMIVIGSITPAFLVFAILLTVAFIMIFLRFIPTSQSLRRLEMISLTPLMSNFGTLLQGLTTVRAFRAQKQFQDRVIRVVDTFQKMDHFYWSLQAWLMYRYDSLAAVSTFLITLLALVTNVSAGLTAFVLLSADKLVRSTHALCKQYGQLQMEFVSVERVIELFHLDQEPKGEINPPAWWPSFSGDIVFKNVTIRYAPHLDPALNAVSFTVKGGSNCAIIGRTGSGKSTLALSLLAAVVPEVGSISIDNIDLAKADKQLLRTRITFLAQDPVLFPGTMRHNLDPLLEHTNEEIERVLDRVCFAQGWTIDMEIKAGGSNLSQGQRQLVGLARAVLRRSAVIILDEATASIDKDTAMQIQQVIQEEMRDSTVITIAHRVEAVKNADYRIVMGNGQILEQGAVA